MSIKLVKKKVGLTLSLFAGINFGVAALTPSFSTLREINFGTVLPEEGSCRMSASTGVITSYIGQNVCILNDDAQNGVYIITANPNKMINIKLSPDQTNGDGLIFNPFLEIVSDGFSTKTRFNNFGFASIDSGADGIVTLYLGGDLEIDGAYSYSQEVTFSFLDAIEWSEDP
jgi:hypothetical protein